MINKHGLVVMILTTFLSIDGGAAVACTTDGEFYSTPDSACLKCEDVLYGCMRCAEETSANSIKYPVCTMCQDGLYLLRNRTYQIGGDYLDQYSYCVPDCSQAHSSYVGVGRDCEWAGQYCQSKFMIQGCEICPGDSGKNWVNTNSAGPQLDDPHFYSTYFKECVPCQNTNKHCNSCQTTNLATCPTCIVSGSQTTTCAIFVPGGSETYPDNNCLVKDSTRKHCLVCKDNYYIKTNGGGTSPNQYNMCFAYTSTTTNKCLTATDPDSCTECYEGFSKKVDPSATPDEKCYPCSENKLYPGIVRCNIDVATGAQTTPKACRDGYINANGKCVTNCGPGKYGQAVLSSRGLVENSLCYDCHADCADCVGNSNLQCTSCKKDRYLERTATTTFGSLLSYGQCKDKGDATTPDKIFYKDLIVVNENDKNLQSNVLLITGATNDPFNFIHDAIQKAYELGAPYKKAKITIKLRKGKDSNNNWHSYHYMKTPISTQQIYVPNKLDNSQTTEIIITTEISTERHVINYFRRDKYTFNVGGGLTFQNLDFGGVDGYSAISPQRVPTENCQINYGIGGSLFKFDIGPYTSLTGPPTLLIDNVWFDDFRWEFNSFVDFNDFGGKVIIQNSKFDNFQTCSSFLRNKKVAIDKSSMYTPAGTDFYTYYLLRANRLLYEEIQKDIVLQVSPNPFAACQTTLSCFSIEIYTTTFSNFGNTIAQVASPITVNPNNGMLYFGMIIDLDGFNGPVLIKDSYFTNIGPRYSTCAVATTLNTNLPLYDPTLDPLSGYGEKSKYQIKSLISIVNHKGVVDIIGNTFQQNSGTKGIIYLDLKHRTSVRRLFMADNIFTQNAGYTDASVIYIRARGPYEGGSVYTRIPTDPANAPASPISPPAGPDSETQTTYYCSGYHFQDNTFQQNIGCSRYGGSLIKFECVDYGQTTTSNIDRIPSATLAANTLTSYKNINFNAHAPRYETPASQPQLLGVSVPVDLNIVTFKINKYYSNFASGGVSLIDIQGAPRVSFSGDEFLRNGDSTKEIIQKYPYVITEAASEMTWRQGFDNTANAYNAQMLTKSLINLERSSQLIMTNTKFTHNWLIENDCTVNRAQILTLNDFAGNLQLSQITITDHTGINNQYVRDGGATGLGWGTFYGPLVGNQKYASKTPMFYFSPTVQFKNAIFEDFTFQNNKAFEDTTCTVDRNLLFSIPGKENSGAQADNFELRGTTLQTFSSFGCYSCTQPYMLITGETMSIKNTLFQQVNSLCFSGTSCASADNPVSAMIHFKIKKPYTDSSLLKTQTLTIDNVQVDYFRAQTYNSNSGRLFLFENQAVATEQEPTSVQITIKNSNFNDIKAYSDGPLALLDIKSIQVLIQATKFQNTYAVAPGAFGGAIKAVSAGAITFDTVTANYFSVDQVTSTDGGGSFFYTNYDGVFTLKILSSVFTMVNFAYGDTQRNIANSLKGDQSSAIYLDGKTKQYTVQVTNSQFQNCITAFQGGALRLSSQSSKVSLTMNGNVFNKNLAVYGGSIYCYRCEIVQSQNNNFTNGYAAYGGDIYLYNLKNIMTTSPVKFSYHNHQYSTAYQHGAAYYYLEDTSLVSIIQLVQEFSSNPLDLSLISDLTVRLQNGAFFYAEVANELQLLISKATMQNNVVSQNGGVVALHGAGKYTLTFQQCEVLLNTATNGYGSIVYSHSTTSNTNVNFVMSNFDGNEAKNDGGLVFLGGLDINVLTIDSSFLQNQKTGSGNGGISSMRGKEARVVIQSVANPAYPSYILNTLTASPEKDGGAFHYIISSGGNGCQLSVSDTNISSTSTQGRGGLFFCSGTGPSTIAITNSKIESTKASGSKGNRDGGVYYLDISGAISMTITNTSFSTQSADYAGGFAYLKGQSVNALIQSKSAIEETSSKLNGGSFYVDTTGSSLVRLKDSSFVNSKSDSQGGFLYAKGGNAKLLMELGAKLTSIAARQSGGIVYLEASGNNEIYMTDMAVISGGESTLGYGGIAYMKGTNNYLKIYNGAVASQCSSKLGGGCFYFAGSTINEIQMIGGAQGDAQIGSSLMTCTSLPCNGGVFYLTGTDQRFTFKQSQIFAVAAKGNGAIIYSQANALGGKINFVDVNAASFKDFYSQQKGSFMYISETNNPTFNLTFNNTQFECSSTGGFGVVEDLHAVLKNVNLTIPQTIGNLFTFEKNAVGIIQSSFNTFQKCNTTTDGSVFYLYKNQILNDVKSNYLQNAAVRGGVLFCEHCTAQFTGSTFYYHAARQASIVFLKSVTDAVDVTFTNCTLSDGFAADKGGAVATEGKIAGKIKFLNCGIIQFFTAINDGGFFYIDNPNLQMEYQETNWNHLYSYYRGGYIYGTNGIHFSFEVKCRLGNITSAEDPGNVGPASGSGGSSISGCEIVCATGTYTEKDVESRVGMAQNRFSVYKYTNKEVISKGNLFKNCLGRKASIFYLENSILDDTESTFEGNGAVQGGVIYCKNCKVNFNRTIFTNNFASEGGIVYVENQGEILFQDVKIQGSFALQRGGLFAGVGSGEAATQALPDTKFLQSVSITIKQTTGTTIPVTFGNIKSRNDGGLVYLQNGTLVIETSQLQDISAGQNGGLIFTDDTVQVTIKSSQFSNIMASKGGLMYSQGLVTQATSSNIAFTGPISFTSINSILGGGVFFFDHPKLDVNMKTTITLSDCHTSQGDGGVFYIQQIQSIDFSPPVGQVSTYKKFSVPSPHYGSLLYSVSRGASISLSNSDISCQENPPSYGSDLSDYLLKANVMPRFGGAIYIQNALIMKSSNNVFHNCYQTSEGSIFYLTSSPTETTFITDFQETGGSLYTQNQAQRGGVIFCDKCRLTLTPTTSSIVFRNNSAQEGGVIFIRNTPATSITSTLFERNYATLKGGVISVQNPISASQGTIVLDKITIDDAKAVSGLQSGQGGAFYIDTVQISLFHIKASLIKNVVAERNGGVIAVGIMKGEIRISDQTTVQEFFVDQNQLGSLFYSGTETNVQLSILNSFITCTSNYLDNMAEDAINQQISTRAGTIFIERSQLGIVSDTNLFQNCYKILEGGIFNVRSSKVKDINSQYKFIQSLYGGVMKCTDCQFSFASCNFDGNKALQGGIFMVENSASGLVMSSSFIGTKAKLQGGVMSVTQSGITQPTITKIEFRNCPKIEDSRADMGAVIYINQPYINITLNSVKISRPVARNGAVAHIERALQFEILNSQIQDIKATDSSLLYSASEQFTLRISRSTVICSTKYTYEQNAAILKQTSVPYVAKNTIFLTGSTDTQVQVSESTFTKCGISEDGGIFRIEGKVNFTDQASTFEDNSAIEGGVISCSGCNITLNKSKFRLNQALRGGTIKLEAQANLTTYQTLFSENSAQEIGGALFATTQSLFNIRNTDFIKNYANVSSTIDALGVSSTLTNYIDLCTFQQNKALKNTISLNKANAVIRKTQFTDNIAQERTKNLFVGFSQINITDCTFRSPSVSNPALVAEREQTMGTFIFVILDVKMLIQNSVFLNGIASYGGAIYVSGTSEVKIESSTFSGNYAGVQGGALYGSGFKGIKISKNSRLTNNIALSSGDDFFLSNTDESFELDEVSISNPQARSSIHAEYIQVKLNRVKITDMKNIKSESGAAIQCIFCRRMIIDNSYFGNIKSQMGGAIYLTDQPENKGTSSIDKNSKYVIRKTTFENIEAYVGGALYLDHPQSMLIQDSTFNRLKALNRSSEQKTDLPSGIAGAIYFGCSFDDPQCALKIEGETTFSNNYAAVKGGAIHWNFLEPVFGNKIIFANNKAGWYGDSISCYAQQLKAITKDEYKRQLDRIRNPYNESSIELKNSTLRRMLLNASTSEDILDTKVEKGSYNTSNVRSGGPIPEFYVAHVDKYGQIVADFDNKVRVGLDQGGYKLDENTRQYTPILAGQQEYTTFGGVAAVDALEFAGAPGYDYKLSFMSTGVDETLPQNKQFKEELGVQKIDFELDVGLRECAIGEYFSQAGKCIWCDQTQGYSLQQMKQPGECKACPSDKADCSGGNDIGPKPGYWRPSNTSSNFLRCPNPDVCLGWVAPTWNPMGQCASGYGGVLCAECDAGYSLSGLAKCAKCPEMTSNVIKLVGMTILLIAMFTFMVRSTLNSAAQPKNLTSIYMKILMNHFQLILLVSSFNFKWPDQLESFFHQTAPVSEASTQVISVDCFLTSGGKQQQSIISNSLNYFHTFFVKLLIFALMPILLGSVSYGFWWLDFKLKHLPAFPSAKAISTLVISLFIIHPNIVQYMFNDFNCKDIDGEKRVYNDMTIKCWEKVHSFWSYSVAMPSIIVWGLGIPFFAFLLMFRERHSLMKIEVKEKFGFLYNGYQSDLFFWEIVIMYRKIAMIFISVFIQPQGVITQAMIVFVIMIGFLIANLKKKPYVSMALNDLETFSLITSAVSIYCGIFFISDIPAKDLKSVPQSVKGVINLSETMKLLFFLVIMLSNIIFFGFWAYKMLQEVKNTLIKKFERVYLAVFLCGDRNKLERLKNKQKIDEENEQLREQYYKALGKLKQLYKDGKLVLTHQTLERTLVYLNEDRYMESLGLAKREISEKDQRRFNRVTQGELVKERERVKHIFGAEYQDQADAKRRARVFDGELVINDEFMKAGEEEKEEQPRHKRRGHDSTYSYTSHNGFISPQIDGPSPYGEIETPQKSLATSGQVLLPTMPEEQPQLASGNGETIKIYDNLDESIKEDPQKWDDQEEEKKEPHDYSMGAKSIATMINKGQIHFKASQVRPSISNNAVQMQKRKSTIKNKGAEIIKSGSIIKRANNQAPIKPVEAKKLHLEDTQAKLFDDKIEKELKMLEKSDSMSDEDESDASQMPDKKKKKQQVSSSSSEMEYSDQDQPSKSKGKAW